MLSSSPAAQGKESAVQTAMLIAFFIARRLRVEFFTRCFERARFPEPVDRFFYFFLSFFSSSPARGLSVSSSFDFGMRRVCAESRFSRASSREEVNVT